MRRHRPGRRTARAGMVLASALALVAGPAWEGAAADTPRPAAAPGPADGTSGEQGTKNEQDGKTEAPGSGNRVPAGERDTVLGKDWRSSDDTAWTGVGDATGFHILVADRRDGYRWRTATTLSEPGFDTDTWIGNTCVTGTGEHVVAVYAPRTFTNEPELMARGGFTAVVELATGKVTKLDLQASLSYYNPGCGTGETAVLTQSGGSDKPTTRLVRVDAADGKPSRPVETAGQVTSAVPAEDGGVIAASGNRIVRVHDDGTQTPVARTNGVPYRLKADADGGVVFLDRTSGSGTEPPAPLRKRDPLPQWLAPGGRDADRTEVKRVTAEELAEPSADGTRPEVLAEGPLTATGLTRSATGEVFVTGRTTPRGDVPATVRRLADSPKHTRVTTRGEAALTATGWADGKDSRVTTEEAGVPRPVAVGMTVLGTGRKTSFTVDPAGDRGPHAEQGRQRSPKLAAPHGGEDGDGGVSTRLGSPRVRSAALATGDRTELVESERYCSVPRNDPRNQAMQPKPRQIEWAVNQAIEGELDRHIDRAENWKNLGMPAYQPQTLFPRVPLRGGGRVPAQVMLGVTAQESNMWQASRVAVPGVTANPLIGNYYGIDYYDSSELNDWDIDWSEADCGYGVTQVTDHMRRAGYEDGGPAAWPYQKQRAVALDYTANIAAGLRILSDKWNQTHAAGLTVNDGDAGRLENWFFALWAYNSGFHPDRGDGSPWGVGWFNNPANPEWDAGRTPFMEDLHGNEEPHDAAHPQDWPYQEKVLGFAAHPPAFLESPGTMVPAFRAAWWNGTEGGALLPGSAKYHRAKAKPPEDMFCGTANDCDPGRIGDDGSNDSGATGPCLRDDFKCWWNEPVVWKDDCDYSCGNEFVRFDTSYDEEADGTAYPPNCTRGGLPDDALIIDDLPDGTPSVRPGCSRFWENAGTFALDFGEGEANEHPATGGERVWPGKVDTHQLGAGFGGHFYFTHTRKDDAKGNRLKVTASWKLDGPVPEGEAEVLAHLPDHGAHTRFAEYRINTIGGWRTRTVEQQGDSNRWVSLGAYRFGDTVPEVRLDSITPDGTGEEDIAFDAIAFVPGDHSPLPDITLPAPDPDAPFPDIPMYLQDTDTAPFAAGPERQRARGGQGGETCRDVGEGEEICLRSTPMTGKDGSGKDGPAEPRKAPEGRASTTADEVVPWCDGSRVHRFTRFGWCTGVKLEITYHKDRTPVGMAEFDIRQEILTDPKTKTVKQAMTVRKLRHDSALKTITLSFDTHCRTNCTAGSFDWDRLLQWTPSDSHVSRGTASAEWTGSGGQETIYLDWSYVGLSTAAPNPFGEPMSTSGLKIRCDDIAKGAKNPGCIFPDYVPTYLVNTARYPAAAATYWLAMEKLPGHPGSRKHSKPLHYLADKARRDANRAVICPTSGAGKFVGHPDTPSASCDEYAFASTYESGGMPGSGVTSGAECVQLYTKELSTHTWKLYDDERFPFPTWTEKCVRASIPTGQNTGAASRIGLHFVPKMRLLDRDEYWLETPGFEDCRIQDVCIVRPPE